MISFDTSTHVSAVKEDVMDNDEESDHENIPNDKPLNVYKKTDKEDTGVLVAVGKKFSSFADLERAITLFEERNFVKFWKRELALSKQQRNVSIVI